MAESFDFVEITSNNKYFDLNPDKIAGVEYESTSIYFPKMIKGTQERNNNHQKSTTDEKKILIAKSKIKILKMKLALLEL